MGREGWAWVGLQRHGGTTQTESQHLERQHPLDPFFHVRHGDLKCQL